MPVEAHRDADPATVPAAAENHASAAATPAADEYSLQAQLDTMKAAETSAVAKTIAEQIDAMPGLSSNQRDWLKRHTEVVVDPSKTMRVKFAHEDALGAGHAQDSPAYYEFLENRLGYRAPAALAAAAPERRSIPMSAPVSRASYSGGSVKPGRVELSAAEVEAAKFSGVSVEEYARHKLRLQQAKAEGRYQEPS